MDLFILKNMMKEATCRICQKLMTDSMSIDCGHSYCRSCIVNINESKSVILSLRKYFCPQCHTPIESTSLRPNKQLQNIIKMLKEMDLGDLCEKHGDVLHLFCEDDGQFICCYCELLLSRKHQGHTILSIRTCQGYKQKLLETVEKLREMENQCKCMMTSIEEQITECVEKILHQKQKVQSDFKNLKDFLHEEEKSYLWRLEKEKEKVLQRLKDDEASLEKQSQELQNYIQQLEEKCQGSDEILLQDVKDTLKRSSAIKLDLPEPVSLNLEIMCNVSKLYFDVKKIAKSYQESQEPASNCHSVPISQSSGVSPGLDKTEGSSVCNTCLEQNTADCTKCVACEEAKPSAQSACKEDATSSLSSKSAAHTFRTQTTSSGFFQNAFKTENFQFGKPEVSWSEQWHSDRVFNFLGVTPEHQRGRLKKKPKKKGEIKPEAFKLDVSSDSGSTNAGSGSFSFSKGKEDLKCGISLDSKSEEAKESQTKENFKSVPLSSLSNATSGTHVRFAVSNLGQQGKKEKLPQSSSGGFMFGTANPTSAPDSKKDCSFGTLETKSISPASFIWKIPEAIPKTMLEAAVGNLNPTPVPPATKFVGGRRKKKGQKPVASTSLMFGANTGNKEPTSSFRSSEPTKDKSSSKTPFTFSLRNPSEKESEQPALPIFPLKGQTTTTAESQEPASSCSTVPISQSSEVSPGLDKTEGSWVCNTCLEQNTADCTKCVACYGAKSTRKDITTSLSNTGNFGKPEVFKLGVSADSGSINPMSGSFSFSEVKKDVKLGFPLDSKSEEAKESQTKENFNFAPLSSLSNGLSKTPFQFGASNFGKQEKKEKLPQSSSSGFMLGTGNLTSTPESKKDCTFGTLGTKSTSPAPFTWKTPKTIPKTMLGIAAPEPNATKFVGGWTEKEGQKPVASASLMFGANTGDKKPTFSFMSSEPTKDKSSSKSLFTFNLNNLSEKESEQPALPIFPLEGQTTTTADITTSLSNTGNFQFGKPEVFKLGVSADSGSINPMSGSFSFSEVKKDVKLGFPLDSKSEEAKESQTKENFNFAPLSSLSNGLSKTPFQFGASNFGKQEKKEKLPQSSSSGFMLGTGNLTSTPESKKDCTFGTLGTKSTSPAPFTWKTPKTIPKTMLGVAAPEPHATKKKGQKPVASASLMFGANTDDKKPTFSFMSSEPTKDKSSSKSPFTFSLKNLSEKESEQPALPIFPLEGQTTTTAESPEPVSSCSTVPNSQSSGVSLGLDKTEASWDCKCLVQNKADHSKCVSCEEPKPNAQSACKDVATFFLSSK